MDHHYFYVQQRGMFYVAAISFKMPEGNNPAPHELILGQVHINCIASPAQMRSWADLMSDLSDTFVNGAFKKAGIKNGVKDSETIEDNVPVVN